MVLSIHVGNLTESVSKEDLSSLFEEHGPVERINIVVDRESGTPRGFAFVDMTNEDDARAALGALDGRELGGEEIKLSIANSQTRGGRTGAARRPTPPPRPEGTEIYVSNIPKSVEAEELQSLFEQHGKVTTVRVIKDLHTGEPRGFAFVDMPDEAERNAAISELHEHELQGQLLAVRKANPPSRGRGRRPPRRPPRDRD